MKILLSTTVGQPNSGGLWTHLNTLSINLKGRGHSVDEASFTHFTTAQKMAISGFGLLKFAAPRSALLQARLKHIRSQAGDIARYQILNAHDPFAFSALHKANERARVPIVSTVHGPLYEHCLEAERYSDAYLAYVKKIENLAIENSDHLIAVDQGQRDLLVKKGAPAEKVTIIENAVDVAKIQAAAGAKTRQEQPYFVIARRLVNKNGVIYGVKAFLEWATDKNIRLVIAGDGDLRPELEKLAKNHANGGKVTFLGQIGPDRLFPLINNALATLVPSVPYKGVIEATSIAALESLALNTPVIASNIGGLKDIDGGNGILHLTEPGDIGQLMQALEQLSKASDQGDRLSNYVASHFGSEAWLDKYLAVYNATLAINGGAPIIAHKKI